MNISQFETETFFEKYEFSSPVQLSCSDCETISIGELFKLGNGNTNEFLNLKLGYTETCGSLDFRTKISSLYQGLKPDNFIVLNAPVEGIYLICQALLQKNDHAIIMAPAYDALLNIPLSLTSNISLWKIEDTDRRWKIDISQLEKLVSNKTKLLILNSPHNPTGFHFTKQEQMRIIEIAKEYDLWIFSDEMYTDLEYTEEEKIPSFTQVYHKAVSLKGLSKNAGLPGLRFGWIATTDQSLKNKIVNFKFYTSLCSPITLEYLGILGIEAYQYLCRKNRDIIQANLNKAESFFLRHQDLFTWNRPMAGPVSTVKLLAGGAEKFCHEMAKKHGVVLLPSRFMGLEDNYFRIGLGRLDFSENLNIFEQKLNS